MTRKHRECVRVTAFFRTPRYTHDAGSSTSGGEAWEFYGEHALDEAREFARELYTLHPDLNISVMEHFSPPKPIQHQWMET